MRFQNFIHATGHLRSLCEVMSSLHAGHAQVSAVNDWRRIWKVYRERILYNQTFRSKLGWSADSCDTGTDTEEYHEELRWLDAWARDN